MPNICHELIIGAPVEKVYHAITSQEGLSAWWTPETIAKAEVGSIARFDFGSTYFKEMKITALKPSELVRWTCVSEAAEWVDTNISFRLESGSKLTLLNAHPETGDQMQQNKSSNVTFLAFQHNDWKQYSPMYAECNYTWGRFLRSLKLFCETGKGMPWPNQHV